MAVEFEEPVIELDRALEALENDRAEVEKRAPVVDVYQVLLLQLRHDDELGRPEACLEVVAVQAP